MDKMDNKIQNQKIKKQKDFEDFSVLIEEKDREIEELRRVAKSSLNLLRTYEKRLEEAEEKLEKEKRFLRRVRRGILNVFGGAFIILIGVSSIFFLSEFKIGSKSITNPYKKIVIWGFDQMTPKQREEMLNLIKGVYFKNKELEAIKRNINKKVSRETLRKIIKIDTKIKELEDKIYEINNYISILDYYYGKAQEGKNNWFNNPKIFFKVFGNKNSRNRNWEKFPLVLIYARKDGIFMTGGDKIYSKEELKTILENLSKESKRYYILIDSKKTLKEIYDYLPDNMANGGIWNVICNTPIIFCEEVYTIVERGKEKIKKEIEALRKEKEKLLGG